MSSAVKRIIREIIDDNSEFFEGEENKLLSRARDEVLEQLGDGDGFNLEDFCAMIDQKAEKILKEIKNPNNELPFGLSEEQQIEVLGKQMRIHEKISQLRKEFGLRIEAARDRRIIKEAMHELQQGLEVIKKYGKGVVIFGTARSEQGEYEFELTKELAKLIATELKKPIYTGGGPGNMWAGNQGAKEAGGKSIGFSITLQEEQGINDAVEDGFKHHFFFTRKVCFAVAADFLIVTQGGYGTKDELFEVLTLNQTGKQRPPIPIILLGNGGWKTLLQLIYEDLPTKKNRGRISKGDEYIFAVLDTPKQVIDYMKKWGDGEIDREAEGGTTLQHLIDFNREHCRRRWIWDYELEKIVETKYNTTDTDSVLTEIKSEIQERLPGITVITDKEEL